VQAGTCDSNGDKPMTPIYLTVPCQLVDPAQRFGTVRANACGFARRIV
jgi:hypothetical protein